MAGKTLLKRDSNFQEDGSPLEVFSLSPLTEQFAKSPFLEILRIRLDKALINII